jgi:hypothetical protein
MSNIRPFRLVVCTSVLVTSYVLRTFLVQPFCRYLTVFLGQGPLDSMVNTFLVQTFCWYLAGFFRQGPSDSMATCGAAVSRGELCWEEKGQWGLGLWMPVVCPTWGLLVVPDKVRFPKPDTCRSTRNPVAAGCGSFSAAFGTRISG